MIEVRATAALNLGTQGQCNPSTTSFDAVRRAQASFPESMCLFESWLRDPDPDVRLWAIEGMQRSIRISDGFSARLDLSCRQSLLAERGLEDADLSDPGRWNGLTREDRS